MPRSLTSPKFAGPFHPAMSSRALDSRARVWYTRGMTSASLALTTQEDSFALAVIEYSGNLGAAYRSVFGEDVTAPVAKARELLTRPEIAKRIQALSVAVEEHAYVSLGSHLIKLAEIRDLAVGKDQLKVALQAEQARGTAAGFYREIPKEGDPAKDGRPSVVINIGKSSANVQDWSAKHGKPPIVIDVTPHLEKG